MLSTKYSIRFGPRDNPENGVGLIIFLLVLRAEKWARSGSGFALLVSSVVADRFFLGGVPDSRTASAPAVLPSSRQPRVKVSRASWPCWLRTSPWGSGRPGGQPCRRRRGLSAKACAPLTPGSVGLVSTPGCPPPEMGAVQPVVLSPGGHVRGAGPRRTHRPGLVYVGDTGLF